MTRVSSQEMSEINTSQQKLQPSGRHGAGGSGQSHSEPGKYAHALADEYMLDIVALLYVNIINASTIYKVGLLLYTHSYITYVHMYVCALACVTCCSYTNYGQLCYNTI